MIVVFGSLNIDLLFRVGRLPQPGETVLTAGYATEPGGKGMNQAIAAARAGARVAMVGCVGRDGFADTVLSRLAAEGVDPTGVRRVEAPTGCAAIAVDDGGGNAIVVASGANLAATADMVPDALLDPANLLLLQMEVPPEENWRLLRRARSAGMRTLLNLAPFRLVPAASLPAIGILVLNEIEATQVAAHLGQRPLSLDDAAAALARQCGGACVVTLGADGALAAERDRLWRTPALPVTAVDTTGAGDAFVGAMAAALDGGEALPDAMRWGAVAGALACTAVGAQASLPDAATIRAALPRLGGS